MESSAFSARLQQFISSTDLFRESNEFIDVTQTVRCTSRRLTIIFLKTGAYDAMRIDLQAYDRYNSLSVGVREEFLNAELEKVRHMIPFRQEYLVRFECFILSESKKNISAKPSHV